MRKNRSTIQEKRGTVLECKSVFSHETENTTQSVDLRCSYLRNKDQVVLEIIVTNSDKVFSEYLRICRFTDIDIFGCVFKKNQD